MHLKRWRADPILTALKVSTALASSIRSSSSSPVVRDCSGTVCCFTCELSCVCKCEQDSG